MRRLGSKRPTYLHLAAPLVLGRQDFSEDVLVPFAGLAANRLFLNNIKGTFV